MIKFKKVFNSFTFYTKKSENYYYICLFIIKIKNIFIIIKRKNTL